MPTFSEHYKLGLNQRQLDFVDVSNEYDIPVYVDPYAIEIKTDPWACRASNQIRVFFLEVLSALREDDIDRAIGLMSHLQEPQETYLGVSRGVPQGRGVGYGQSRQLIGAISASRAFETGLLKDFSDMSLYVEGIDRDKISDLTTNVIRDLLVEYTQSQCRLYDIPLYSYSSPPIWKSSFLDWRSTEIEIPYIEHSPVILIPKYIVRRKLSINSQEFYNKQVTDFLIAENIRAYTSLVRTVKGEPKVFKGEVRSENPFSKSFISEIVIAHPEILEEYKKIAKMNSALAVFNDNEPSLTSVCRSLAAHFRRVPPGASDAEEYHRLIVGTLTALFYPDLLQPRKEWEIHDGRKRIDIVFTNAAEQGFFAHRRADQATKANMIIVECKNYSRDIANPELDQLIGRFDRNRGYLGIIACRDIADRTTLVARCKDAAARLQGYMIALTDKDFTDMLEAKANLKDDQVEAILHLRYREIIG